MRAITVDEALAALAEFDEDGRKITHAFLGMFGADWDTAAAQEEIRKFPDRICAADPGTMAWGANHRVVIPRYTERGSALAFESRPGAFE